ncbi:MAG: hypothetical protein A2268_08375 [Candidatus Raymondbacteria bacterium RifOxyA12_full_50_37]|uniref:3-dehydroquinate dehydratase n=1 Tax=Candidatus Raymondbacteria bacterium RIFOXYD12_FULL_49_13 TaxID=1817890 RepID=A0A1F7F3R7_UNCRA|nr:MAG: hypothetical protein A2268_08375 [Candidatus Raymondbacteria bacterium RifOxyA12_full_50_37]OGJ90349.1 MAG: hypothetical protein A2248_17310 [Candidatus Raymondbacteria bacterium RIFOXYA2_FULL_49_16]OGK01315.1 MAG: hypothetical protein A2519_13010 [Candidatus Raymondbacteria bacterium RIFOXYD12_FULL_49_13]OGP43248.1 MAG: hypothetical protein A2324_08140 [Candidatus Raymondbacteria bacterium RIFOXYB2_FULL_49_35]
MKPVRIGPIPLAKKPLITAVVDVPQPADKIVALCCGAVSLFEFRLDLLDMRTDVAVKFIRAIRARTRCGCIATFRETSKNRARRLGDLKEILPHVDAVDEEITSANVREIVRAARGKIVILSHHDFKKTPDLAAIRKMALRAKTMGAHVFKIAAHAKTQKDVARLLSFVGQSPLPCVAIAMGALGAISRVTAPLFGSLFSYGYTGKRPVAPGQLHVKRLAELFALFYPNPPRRGVIHQ